MTGSPDLPGTEVRVEGLRRLYNSLVAVDGLDLVIAPGELIALLGPSGCGKTTALRIIAGLDDADAGRVIVDGKDVTHVSAHRRDMGMMFQSYSLFPHLTALQNVEFGLRLRKASRAQQRARAGSMLELVGLSTHADKYPRQMSGGQQQRVALARALAIEPTVLLLDEPLAALDAVVRAQLRDEIRRIQLEVGTTTLFVTHDQEEALAIADRVGVMNAGRLEQLGSPADIYSRPQTLFVAEFVGLSNHLRGSFSGTTVEVLGESLPTLNKPASHGIVTALVRPEAVRLTELTDGATASNSAGRVVGVTFLGPRSHVRVAMDDGSEILAALPTHQAIGVTGGARVRVGVRPDPVYITPSSSTTGASPETIHPKEPADAHR
jgi:putative spermidine/putrescine transport system ATP-binding protein